MSHTDYFRGLLVGRTIKDVVHEDPDTHNKMYESITLTLDDGSGVRIWSFGYSMDATFTPPRSNPSR